MYFKISGDYTFLDDFIGAFDIIYSRAMEENSYQGEGKNLGVEIDFEISYFTEDNFGFNFQYGMLIPMKGLNYVTATENINSELAQTIQTNLSVEF